jgi:hypothetical protein
MSVWVWLLIGAGILTLLGWFVLLTKVGDSGYFGRAVTPAAGSLRR